MMIVGVFLVVLALIFLPYWLFVERPEQQEARSIRSRLTTRRPVEIVNVVKDDERMSQIGTLDRTLEQFPGLSGSLQRLVVQADVSYTVGALVLAAVFAAMLFGVAAWVVLHSLIVAAPVAAVAGAVPFLYLRYKATRRLAKFEEQFPEAIDLIARALRAGHALTTSLQMAGDEIPEPVGGEFRLLFDQQNFGMSLPQALRAFAERVPLLDARFFVTALLTQRETGGNLSEVLDNLAFVIRERFKVKRQVRVISAHGRITGWVLGFLPPTIGLILYIIAPAHTGLLFTDPIGRTMLYAAIVLQIVGVLIIRRIVDVEY